MPIHGLMSYLRGMFSSLFFDGTAASYAASDILLMGLASTALALSACRVVTPLGALLLLGGALPDHDRMYFYIPAFLAIAAPQLVGKPIRLLVAWLPVNKEDEYLRFRLTLVSRSVGHYSRPFTFDVSAEDLLIPMGGYPRWLLAKDLTTIRFDLLNPDRVHSFRFSKLEFLHLNDP